MMANDQVVLVTRADDAGSSDSANRATYECATNGIVRNVSLMIAGPAIGAASDMFQDMPDIALGLHVTLNSEWDNPRWGPVSDAATVPSLVEDGRFFTKTPMVLHERGFRLEEAMSEVESQLDFARELGLNIVYLDEHMGVGWLAGFADALTEFCRKHGLVRAPHLPWLPEMPPVASAAAAAAFGPAIEKAPPGRYLLLGHPTFDDEETRAISGAGVEPGSVARQRDADRRLFQDPAVVRAADSGRVRLARYTDL